MKRKLLAALFAFAVSTSAILTALLLALPLDTLAQKRGGRRGRRPARPSAQAPVRQPARNAPATSGSQDARLNAIADGYLEGYYAFNPTEATALGVHKYDSELESRSRDSIERETRRLRGVLAELGRIREGALTPAARYDFLVLEAHARGQLLELEELRMWQRDPNVYNRLIAASIDNILKRNYAPIEQRLNATLARQRRIPELLGEARANLQTPPRIYTETAISQVRGSVDYFSRVVPQMIERQGGA